MNQLNTSLTFNENIFSQAKHWNILTCKKQIEKWPKTCCASVLTLAYFLNKKRKSVGHIGLIFKYKVIFSPSPNVSKNLYVNSKFWITYKEFVRLYRRELQHSVQGMLNIWRPGQHRDTQPDLATDRQTDKPVRQSVATWVVKYDTGRKAGERTCNVKLSVCFRESKILFAF